MSSMRGGFKSAVKGATGAGKTGAAESPTKRFLWNLVTIALAIAAAVVLLKRFGVLR
jgi:cell division protein FtsI/penicillin-binding protein 2